MNGTQKKYEARILIQNSPLPVRLALGILSGTLSGTLSSTLLLRFIIIRVVGPTRLGSICSLRVRCNEFLSVATRCNMNLTRTFRSLSFELIPVISFVAHFVIRSTPRIVAHVRPIIGTLLSAALFRDHVLWVCLELGFSVRFLLGVTLKANSEREPA